MGPPERERNGVDRHGVHNGKQHARTARYARGSCRRPEVRGTQPAASSPQQARSRVSTHAWCRPGYTPPVTPWVARTQECEGARGDSGELDRPAESQSLRLQGSPAPASKGMVCAVCLHCCCGTEIWPRWARACARRTAPGTRRARARAQGSTAGAATHNPFSGSSQAASHP